jgi:hypothetical protein
VADAPQPLNKVVQKTDLCGISRKIFAHVGGFTCGYTRVCKLNSAASSSLVVADFQPPKRIEAPDLPVLQYFILHIEREEILLMDASEAYFVISDEVF